MILPLMVQLIIDAGFNGGWVVYGETLTVWEHDADPPAPLTRPEPIEPIEP